MVIDDNNLINKIAKLENEVFCDSWSVNSIRDTMNHEYNVIFVVEDALVEEVSVKVYEGGDGFEAQNRLHDKAISGYLIANNISGETELLRIAIKTEKRGLGLGKILLDEYLKYMADRCEKCFLEVRDSNKAARGLYESTGFKNICKRKNYYSNPTENAVIYEYIFN